MLRYFASGYRDLTGRFHPNWRTNWEFYAVHDGRIAPIFREDDEPPLQEHTLWVFAPESCHGWISEPGRSFDRTLFHFSSVPHALETHVRANGNWLAKKLTRTELARIKRFAAELEPHFRRPTVLSPLHFQARLLDLSIMLTDGRDAPPSPSLPDLALHKVENALSWYAEHLSLHPSIKEVAGAVHISPSHLRRLFWQIRAASPKQACQKIRLEQAQEFMGRSALTLDEVARHCGFASASHLCREFKQSHHITPTFWRKKVVMKFLDPSASTPARAPDRAPRLSRTALIAS